MADVELVIKIEEETYNRIMNGWMPLHKAVNLIENVQKGTPLPKGHGRLIDEKVAYRKFYARCLAKAATEVFAETPTIIEADKERS